MHDICPICGATVQGVRSEGNAPEGVYFNFRCAGADGSKWTRMYPPVEPHDAYMAEIQFSERVLVRIEDERHMYFARYSYTSERWSVEGCLGDFNVVEWWPLPKDEGVHV